jgi:hypothetical protein
VDLETKGYKKAKTVEMKSMWLTAGYSLLDHRRNEDILEELKGDPVENKQRNVNKTSYIMSARWKTSDTHNNPLTNDLSEHEDH